MTINYLRLNVMSYDIGKTNNEFVELVGGRQKLFFFTQRLPHVQILIVI